MKDSQAQGAFSDLSSSENIKAGTQKALENFTAKVCGCQNPKLSLNDFRYEVFDKAFGPKKNSSNQLEKLFGMNASMLPPCQAELATKLKRVKFVAKMWTDAHKKEINTTPTEKKMASNCKMVGMNLFGLKGTCCLLIWP